MRIGYILCLAVSICVILLGCDKEEAYVAPVEQTPIEQTPPVEQVPIEPAPANPVGEKGICDVVKFYPGYFPELNCSVTPVRNKYSSKWQNESLSGTKWQLVLDYSSGSPVDVSCDSIFYTFTHPATLTISSGNIDAKYNYIHNMGFHPYCSSCYSSISVESLPESFDYIEFPIEVWTTVLYIYDYCDAGDSGYYFGNSEYDRWPIRNHKTLYRVEVPDSDIADPAEGLDMDPDRLVYFNYGNHPDLNCPIFPIDGEYDNPEGKWQLIIDYTSGSPVDVSCDSIFYTFSKRSEGALTINADNTESKHDYTFYSWPYHPLVLIDAAYANLIIDDIKMSCHVFPAIMYMMDYCESLTMNGLIDERPCKNVKTFYRVE